LEKCVGSFLDHLSDRDDYRLRWICHLDQYGLGGLEDLWPKQVEQIMETSLRFDDFVLILQHSHVGYGGAFLRILKEVNHGHLFYTDDDQLFHTTISLAEALAAKVDHYTWHNALPGSTVPSLWSGPLVLYVQQHYPSMPRRVTERTLQALAEQSNCTSNRDPDLDGNPREHWPSQNYGRFAARGKCAKFGPHRCYIDEEGKMQRVGRRQAIEVASKPPEQGRDSDA
jgi:hypothetical protein